MVAGVFARNMTNDFFVRDGALLFWSLAGMLFGYALRHRSTLLPDETERCRNYLCFPAERSTRLGG